MAFKIKDLMINVAASTAETDTDPCNRCTAKSPKPPPPGCQQCTDKSPKPPPPEPCYNCTDKSPRPGPPPCNKCTAKSPKQNDGPDEGEALAELNAIRAQLQVELARVEGIG